jgi:hypothetical protein
MNSGTNGRHRVWRTESAQQVVISTTTGHRLGFVHTQRLDLED